jgi:hypothetical protein
MTPAREGGVQQDVLLGREGGQVSSIDASGYQQHMQITAAPRS